jgi:hypothetical protein
VYDVWMLLVRYQLAWCGTAVRAGHRSLSSHLIFDVFTQGGSTDWIVNSLPFFAPKPSFFMVDVYGFKGNKRPSFATCL